jgi:hypothetical protein
MSKSIPEMLYEKLPGISQIISPTSPALVFVLLVSLVLPFPLLGVLAHLVSFAPVVFSRLVLVSGHDLNADPHRALYISKGRLTIPAVCFSSPTGLIVGSLDDKFAVAPRIAAGVAIFAT